MQFVNDKLPDNPKELKAIILCKDQDITILEEQVRVLKKAIFGRKSEKPTIDEEVTRQLHLFNEGEAPVEQEAQKELIIPEHTRQKPKRKPLPKDLPRVDVIHDIEESEKLCDCGAELYRIGEEVREKLDITSARLRVIRHIRYKCACRSCERVESSDPTVKIVPLPLKSSPGG
jgi:hypothetical protein